MNTIVGCFRSPRLCCVGLVLVFVFVFQVIQIDRDDIGELQRLGAAALAAAAVKRDARGEPKFRPNPAIRSML